MRRALFLVLVGLAGTAVLCGLGYWQLERLAWKREVIATIEQRIAAAPTGLPAAPDPAADAFRPVYADGLIEAGEIRVYLSAKGRGPGYRIVAPLRIGNRRILLDRGFVPVSAYDGPSATGPVSVQGNLHWPDEIDGYTPAPDLVENLWFGRDVPAMAAALGTEPVLLVAATGTDPSLVPLPVGAAGIPNDHLQYAITWFLLAAVWLGMSVLFARRMSATRSPDLRGSAK